jgi:predicted Zn-dependent peptidase
MSKLAKDEMYFGCHIAPREIMADIDRVSAEQLWRLSRDLFDDRYRTMTALGPLKNGKIERIMQ